ncbi:MAG: hypothetical protein MI919_32095, partial [Holophagales bacterium]|nr:hypothetical protein [Holophagales bacterium]
INCSGVWTAGHGREIADAMARELAQVEAVPLGHPESRLASFPNPGVAHAISDMIDDELRAGGAEDLTARYRHTPRVAEAGGCTFLLPTVVYTDDPGHSLASAEYIFPYVTVVDCPEERLLEAIGPPLIGSVVAGDSFVREALRCQHIDRLNLGPIPTYKISWDQPHEGNLFDHLYQQRAFQMAS